MYSSLPARRLSRRTALKLGLGTTVLGAVGSGAGCAPVTPDSGGAQGDNTFTIYWNAGHSYKAYESVIDQFGKDNDLQINWQKFQWPDLATKLTADFKSGSVPDLVEEMSAGTGTQYGIAGNVMAIDDLAKSEADLKFPDDFVKGAVTARQYEGKSYSVPFHLTANGLLFYNKQLLADAGFAQPPSTWEEFSEMTKATTRNRVSGTALNSDPGYSAPFYCQQGVAFSDLAKQEFLTPEAGASKALQYMQDLIFTQKVSPAPVATTDYSGPQKLFSARRAASFVSGPWDLAPVRQGSPDIELGLAAPLKGSVRASSLAGSGLMIPTKAKNPELSMKLVAKLTALETELAATKEAGMSMPRKSWAQDPTVVSDENLKVIAAAVGLVAEQDVELSASGKLSQVSDLYKKAYQQIVIQQRPVDQTLAEFRTQAKSAVQ